MLSLQSGRYRLLYGILAFSLAVSPVMATSCYTVKSGDTLEQIAHRLSVPQAELVRLNELDDSDTLAIGQELQLPSQAKSHHHSKTAEGQRVAARKGQQLASTAMPNMRDLTRQRRALLAKGTKVVTQAQTMLGTPYVWGGSSSRGTDCSGLVLNTMREALGKIVPHHAADLYHMGTPVTYGQLVPGDLLFFNTNASGSGVTHVGIWVGNNTFIHASCSQGVTQQKLTGYFAKRLVGARRLK